MESVRILLAMNNDTSIDRLQAILTENGYMVVEKAKDGHDCLRKARALRPDIVILDYDLPLANGCEVSRIVIEDNICEVILITTDLQRSLIGDIRAEYGFVCMTKPLSKLGLINTIELMAKNRKKVTELEKEIHELKSTLDTRKEVEKAKGLLMKYLSIPEAEAFKRIQKQSMDRGIPMKEIAKAIILAYDI